MRLLEKCCVDCARVVEAFELLNYLVIEVALFQDSCTAPVLD